MITSTSNQHAKRIRELQGNAAARHEQESFILEGVRLVREALLAGSEVQLILVTESVVEAEHELVDRAATLGISVKLASEEVLASCSDTQSPQGILAVVSFPRLPLPLASDLVLIVDRLSDPGNLGTLLRTGWAAGVDAVYLTQGTVDPYNPKVIRGAMGAHLQLPILKRDYEELQAELQGLRLVLAEAGSGRPYDQVNWRVPVGLAIGSEAHGPHLRLRELVRDQVHIPMADSAESLNAAVAAAVILFEIRRQRGST